MMKHNSGFSLMELMVVIAIVGILSTVAVPNLIRWRNNSQINAATRDMYAAFKMAKSAAIKNNTNCTIGFGESVDGTTYDYVVFLESRTGFDLAYNAGETVLKKVNFSEFGSVAFNMATFSSNGTNPAVCFRPNGLPIDASGNPAGGSVFLDGAMDKEIVLTGAGVVNINS